MNRGNNPDDGVDTDPQTTLYTVFTHPDPQEDPTGPWGPPGGIDSVGLARIVEDKTVFETDTANQNNWEPFASVIGNSTFVVEANTFADPEDDYNQRYVLVFQPVAGGEAKMGEVFYSDSGAPYTGQINGSRQNGNPGRVAGDTRPGAVNFIAGGEASPHMFDEFQSDDRWDLGVDRLDDGRYGAVQTYSLDPETLVQTPLSNAIDAINGRLDEGDPPGNQIGRFGGDMVGLSNGNFAVVIEDKSNFHTDGGAATAVIIAPDGWIVTESFVIANGSIWSNVAAFKGGWAARVGGVIYFFDNDGEELGEADQSDSGIGFEGGRGDGTRIYGHINSPYLFMAGVAGGQVQLAAWDSRDQSFVASTTVSEENYEAAFGRVNLASDALNRVVVAYESKPTAEDNPFDMHQVTARVLAFDAASGSFSPLTSSFFAFKNNGPSEIRTLRPTVAMTTKEILIAAKGEVNRGNNPDDGVDTDPQTTLYTVISHPDPQADPTEAVVIPASVASSTESVEVTTIVDFGDLSGDASYEFFFKAIKSGVSTAIAGNNAFAIKLDQWDQQGVFGTTVFGVVDNVFTPAEGKSVESVFDRDVHVVVVNDTAAGETRLYVDGDHVGVLAGNFELAGEAKVMGARINANTDPMGEGSVMHKWATYNSALTDAEIAGLAAAAGGVAPEAPTISIVNNGDGTVTVTFEGTLQAAASVNGPWADVDAPSPMTIPADQAQQFGRAVRK